MTLLEDQAVESHVPKDVPTVHAHETMLRPENHLRPPKARSRRRCGERNGLSRAKRASGRMLPIDEISDPQIDRTGFHAIFGGDLLFYLTGGLYID